MNSGRLSPLALAYVTSVIVTGGVAGFHLLASVGGLGLRALVAGAIFCGLGLLWSWMTFFAGIRGGGRAAITLGPISFLALIVVEPQPVVAAVALATVIFDWFNHGRRLMTALFNMGQTLISLWICIRVAELTTQQIEGPAAIVGGTLVGGLVYSAFNLTMTLLVIWLATGRTGSESGVLGYTALASETVLAFFGSLIALCWYLYPPLILVPVLPLTLMFGVLGRLEASEDSLRRRQKELQAIQELGLRVSAKLDVLELGTVVTKIVAEDMRSQGALLASVTPGSDDAKITAVHDRAQIVRSGALMRRVGLTEDVIRRRVPVIGTQDDVGAFPELEPLNVSQFIIQPLSILGHPEALLIVFDRGTREPFSEDDSRRLTSLVRFIEVALNNAKLYDDVRSMQQQLVQSEKMSALGELISGVAHELNNPLASIMGSAELIADHELPAKEKQMLRRIRKQADRAARIVRNLLTFSRHHKPELDWNSLNEVVEEIMEMRAHEVAVRNIELVADLEENLPLIRMDPYQIHQVVLNLVTNAVHALEDAGRPGKIVVSTRIDGARARVEVADNGPGISEDNLGKIFDPFFTTKQVGKGTGLGLSICYGIIEEHGGTIRASSVPGRGAQFTIDLPVPDDAPTDPAVRNEKDEPTQRHTQQVLTEGGERVLVVDDESGVRSVLVDALTAWGYEVVEAATGTEGLHQLKNQSFAFAIFDLRMPGLDGQQLFERARSELTNMPPVIFSTGDAAGSENRQFLETIDAPLLLKPFSLMSLRETILSLQDSGAEDSAPSRQPVPT